MDRLASGFRHRILGDRVVAIEHVSDGTMTVVTASREYKARNVVIATPAQNSREFYPELDQPADHGLLDVPMATLHVQGLRRSEYKPGKIVYLGQGEAITALLPMGPGFDLLHARMMDPDLSFTTSVIRSSAGLAGRPPSSLRPRTGAPWPRDRACSLSAITTSAAWKTATSPAFSPRTGSSGCDPGYTRPYRSRPAFTRSPVRYV